MDRVLHIVGKNSSEIFMLRYPRSLLNFCEYDLAYFAENAIAICDEALKAGELDFDRVTDLRNSLKSAHVCIEHSIRTVYDKIVLDCWIDYVCRRDNVGTGALWNRFMPCNTAFEKAVFMRLCEYRYNRAINEWLNLVRVQDYAKNKVNFIFSGELKSAEEAAARRNYFDLMFSITARELGCRIEELGVTKVFSVGRLPSSPFLYPNISKDVVKNLLADFDYSEDYSDTDNYGGLSDQIAMDAFSYMKSGLAAEYNSYNISRSEMENSNFRVYMPCGMKSVVDLEIDALIESGGWLARCKRCGRYFVRDEEYPEEYCSLFNPGGKTCLEIYEMEHPRSIITPALERSFREITDEMYSRVGDTMSLEEYESWKIYLDALHGKVENGEIPVEELEDFISYSKSLDISRSNPVREVPKRVSEPVRERERVVKPFIPQRIDRSELEAQRPVAPVVEEEEEEPVIQSRPKSFFTSPTVERQKSKENAPMAHIIRADQSAELLNGFGQQGGFTPFGQSKPIPSTVPKPRQEERYTYSNFGAEPLRNTQEYSSPQHEEPVRTEKPSAYRGEEVSVPNYTESRHPVRETEPEFDFARVSEKLRELREMERRQEEQNAARSADRAAEEAPNTEDSGFELFGDITYDSGDSLETYGNVFDLERDSTEMPQLLQHTEEVPAPETPKPKVIRKNAAAISAYGKISGAPVIAAPQGFSAVSNPEPASEEYRASAHEPVADTQPFKDIGSIFDVLEQSENRNAAKPAVPAEDDSYFVFDRPKSEPSAASRYSEPQTEYEPVEEPEPAPVIKNKPVKREEPAVASRAERVVPEKVTTDNAPSGIWTEERNLFADSETDEELEMLKEKKRTRSSKTQRLFDAIMREPEDNPNVRRKKQ